MGAGGRLRRHLLLVLSISLTLLGQASGIMEIITEIPNGVRAVRLAARLVINGRVAAAVAPKEVSNPAIS